MSPSKEKISKFLEDDNHVLVVAEICKKPIGQAVGYVLKRWDAKPSKLFLYSIDVIETHRRQGIGRQLIEAFRQIGRESGCGSTFVPTSEWNIPAVRLYEASDGKRTTASDAVTFEWVEAHPQAVD